MNADELLVSVKRATALPASQIRLSDTDLLSFADEEIETKLIPMLTELRNEYLVTKESFPLLSGQNEYQIPYRSIGRTVRDVTITQNNSESNLALFEPDDYFDTSQNGFFFRADKIVLTNGNMSGTINIYYELRPSKLVLNSLSARIDSFTSGNVTCASLPTSFANGVLVDFIQAKSGHTLLAKDIAISALSGTSFDCLTPPGLVVGDLICAAEKSSVIMLPQEMHQVLAQAVAVRVMEAIGDFEALQSHNARLQEKLMAVRSLLTPRMRSAPRVIVNYNSFLNRTSKRRRFL